MGPPVEFGAVKSSSTFILFSTILAVIEEELAYKQVAIPANPELTVSPKISTP